MKLILTFLATTIIHIATAGSLSPLPRNGENITVKDEKGLRSFSSVWLVEKNNEKLRIVTEDQDHSFTIEKIETSVSQNGDESIRYYLKTEAGIRKRHVIVTKDFIMLAVLSEDSKLLSIKFH